MTKTSDRNLWRVAAQWLFFLLMAVIAATGVIFAPKVAATTCPRAKSAEPATSVIFTPQAVMISPTQASVTFSLMTPHNFSATAPCPGEPDEVFVHLVTCINVSAASEGGVVEQVCGGIHPTATDVATYTNPTEPITLNIAVRFEQNVCTGVPVGDFPSTLDPQYRKANVTIGALFGHEVGDTITIMSFEDDSSNDG
jgi:hypothetical protein